MVYFIFHCLQCFLQLRNFFLHFFFFKISVSLFNLSSCSCIIFLILLSHLCYPIAHRSSLKQSIAFFLRQLVDLHFFEVYYQQIVCPFGDVNFHCFSTFLIAFDDVFVLEVTVTSSLSELNFCWGKIFTSNWL